MAPVKVFGTADFVNAARVMACLEEVGVEYEVLEVDYTATEHKGPQHLARNPFGQIPAFQDGDMMLFESRAIAKYVLRKYSRSAQVDLLREGNPEEAAMVDVWTEVEAHTYLPAIAPIFYECVLYPAENGTSPSQKVVEESLEKLKKVLDVYEAHLSKSMHLYLAGDFFILADLNHVPYTFRIMRTPHASLFDDDPGSAVAEEAQPRYGDQRLIAKFDDDPGSGCGWGLYALPSFLPDPRIERLVQEL